MAAMYVYNKAFVTKSYGPGQTRRQVILFLFTAIIAVSQAVMNKRKGGRSVMDEGRSVEIPAK